MKTLRLLLVLCALVLTPIITLAAEGQPGSKEPPKDPPKEEAKDEIDLVWDVWIKFFTGSDGVAKDTTFTKDDLQPFLDNYKGLDTLLGGDTAYVGAGITFKGRYDYISKSEAYKKWAKDNKLDADKWLKKYFRLSAVLSRVRLETNKAESEDSAKEARDAAKEAKDNEKLRVAMEQQAERLEKSAKCIQKVIDLMPAPTDDERKLVKTEDETTLEAFESITNG